MRLRVAQRPEVGGRAEQDVDRVDRHVVGQPAHRVDQAGGDVTAAGPDRRGDQGEHPLGIGLPQYQIGSAQFAQSFVEHIEAFQHAVVREDPAVLQERMRVDHVVRSGRRVADVRDEGGAGQVVGFGGELGVFPRGDRLLVHLRAGPGRRKRPSPLPSGFRLLCSARLSGASSSQNVAVTTLVPACSPKSRHISESARPTASPATGARSPSRPGPAPAATAPRASMRHECSSSR